MLDPRSLGEQFTKRRVLRRIVSVAMTAGVNFLHMFQRNGHAKFANRNSMASV